MPDSTPATREEVLQRCLAQKERTRKSLAELPFLDKIRMLIQMQKRAAEILALRGIKRRVWPDF